MKTTRLSPGSFSQQFKENFANLSLFFFSPKKIMCVVFPLLCLVASIYLYLNKTVLFFWRCKRPQDFPPNLRLNFNLLFFRIGEIEAKKIFYITTYYANQTTYIAILHVACVLGNTCIIIIYTHVLDTS